MSKRPTSSKFDPPLAARPGQERTTFERAEHERAPGEQGSGEQGSSEQLQDELGADERELLAAARRELMRGHVPAPVRQRLFERMVDEARRGEPNHGQNHAQPVAALVPVRPRGVWLVLGSAAAMAAGLVLLANGGLIYRGATDGEPLAGGAPLRAEQRLGDRIFQSALFRAAAPEWSGALPPAGTSLFGERPFSMQSQAWQVKHWENLGADPSEPAKYQFEQGGLCVVLGPGERVVGGWPWLPNGGEGTSSTLDRAAPSSIAPAPVALSAGKAYRLVFKAWASEPLPSQLLIAVGHANVPFSAAAGARVDVSTSPEPFVVSFVAKHSDPSVGVAFLANTNEGAEPTRVCLSDMTLTEAPR